MLNKRLLYLPT